MDKKRDDLLGEVANYYSSKILEHGETPQGVDWNGEEGQVLRFEQLYKLITVDQAVTVNDLGCGYGAFFEFLRAKNDIKSYQGVDISQEMIDSAKARFGSSAEAEFIMSNTPDRIADYGFASGIFNVRFERENREWRAYMDSMMDTLNTTSRLGFAFNCLTSYSDEEHMRSDLYYSNPTEIFDYCKNRYSRNVSLIHDYELYEFTIIVRK